MRVVFASAYLNVELTRAFEERGKQSLAGKARRAGDRRAEISEPILVSAASSDLLALRAKQGLARRHPRVTSLRAEMDGRGRTSDTSLHRRIICLVIVNDRKNCGRSYGRNLHP